MAATHLKQIGTAVTADKALKGHLTKDNQWTETPLKIWYSLVGENKGKEPHPLIRWMACDSGFVPNRSDTGFKEWATKGLIKYSDLYTGKH